ncbi:hypothetical protein LCGC14_0612820 [marine sediment metagenome]|uniref:Uncharacterized protein n=1 Tax=marine sediment metagenome TaxID=412755 RepID=A0A0F9UFQ6_9ZZZZ
MEISIDQTQMRDVQAMLSGIKNGYPKVLSRSVNKTVTGVRTDAVNEIYKNLNLTKTRIRKDFKIKKMTWAYLTARIVSKGAPVGLAAFAGTRQTKKGVSVKVKRAGKRSILKHAFIADAKKAAVFGSKTRTHVFWRKYKGPRSKPKAGFSYGALPRTYRLPVERLVGPRIQDILDEPKVMKPVMKMADDRLAVNLQRELNFELSKL